jgi:hypothetical protein
MRHPPPPTPPSLVKDQTISGFFSWRLPLEHSEQKMFSWTHIQLYNYICKKVNSFINSRFLKDNISVWMSYPSLSFWSWQLINTSDMFCIHVIAVHSVFLGALESTLIWFLIIFWVLDVHWWTSNVKIFIFNWK